MIGRETRRHTQQEGGSDREMIKEEGTETWMHWRTHRKKHTHGFMDKRRCTGIEMDSEGEIKAHHAHTQTQRRDFQRQKILPVEETEDTHKSGERQTTQNTEVEIQRK